jgi:hypothetical protein
MRSAKSPHLRNAGMKGVVRSNRFTKSHAKAFKEALFAIQVAMQHF